MRKKSGYINFGESPRKTGYTRISKSEVEGRDTLNRHFQQLREAGATEIYWDVISRSTKKREGLQKIFELIENRQTTEIILIRLDRLTDSIILFEQFINLIEISGVPCRGLHDNIDLTSVGGRTHARLLVTFSRNEIERTSERFRNGWEHVRRRQKAVNPPFGYKVEDNKHCLDHRPFLSLIESRKEYSRAAIARLIIDFFLEEKTLTKTVSRLNQYFGLWHSNFAGTKSGFTAAGGLRISVSGLSLWLTSPVLRGGLVYFRGEDREQIIWEAHQDLLLNQEEYEEIELIMAKNRQQRGYTKKQTHPLSGLVVCAECGGSCYSSVSGLSAKRTKKYSYYRCKNAKVRACSNVEGVSEELIESAVISALIEKAAEIASMVEQADKPEESIEERQLKEQIATIQALGNNYVLQEAIAKLESQLRVIQSKASQEIPDSHKELILAFREESYWKSLQVEEKITIYRKLVRSVLVLKGLVVKVHTSW